jgi:methanogenic corrinoid protein MtbC1
VSDDTPPRLPPVDPAAGGSVDPSTLTPELLASLLADGDDELAAWALRHALREQSRAEVYDGILAGAMRLVGERWETGQWSVAEEHLASQTLLRALERVRPELGPESRIGPLAVLAGVEGEHHMIGLVCLDHILREQGWTVANLGADVPTEDLAGFVRRNQALLVALTASHPARRPALVDAISSVREAHSGTRPLPIMVGGRIATDRSAAESLGVQWAGASLVAAAAFADGAASAISAGG